MSDEIWQNRGGELWETLIVVGGEACYSWGGRPETLGLTAYDMRDTGFVLVRGNGLRIDVIPFILSEIKTMISVSLAMLPFGIMSLYVCRAFCRA